MKENEFNTSYNRTGKFYRLYQSRKGYDDWNKITLDNNNFDFLIKNNFEYGEKYKPFPYKPYFYFRIKWFFQSIWEKSIKLDPKIKKLFNSGFLLGCGFLLLVITSVLTIVSFLISEKRDLKINQKNNQENSILKEKIEQQQIKLEKQKNILDSISRNQRKENDTLSNK
jgi:hypothetical protein